MTTSDPSGPQDARQVRTRAKLLRAMLALLEREPFEAISVRAIAEAARIGYATFFRHYPDKLALLDDLAADEIAELLGRAMPVFTADDSRRACVALFEYVSERRALWRALLTGGAAPILRARFIAEARRIAADFDAGPPAVGAPIDLLVTHATSATLEILAWWLAQGEATPAPEVASLLDRLVIAPVVAAR